MRSEANYTVFGAGSVGSVLACLLADAGTSVCIAGRGATGRLVAEGDEERVAAGVPVVTEPEGVVLLCVHAPEIAGLCADWPGRTVVTFQNGVESEEIAARTCSVIGAVWRMTCTLVAPGHSLFTRRGRVVIGRHPAGFDDEVEEIARDLRAAGFDVGVSPLIRRDKWLKLFVNLASAPNALIRKQDHAMPAFGAIKRALLEEARSVFERAGIDARSCDGRDASLDEEIEKQARGGGRARPVHNATWRRLHRGRRMEERHHETLVRLAEGAGVSAPRNTAMQRLLDAAQEPECYPVAAVASALGL